MRNSRIAIDLFAGTGAATEVLKERGWEVIRVEIDPRFEADFGDVKDFVWRKKDRVDFLWASPPCYEFTKTFMPWYRQNAPSQEAIELVFEVFRIVRETRPRFWIMENVVGAQRWIGKAAFRIGSRYLWGWFPFDKLRKYKFDDLKKKWYISGKNRAIERSKIERSIAEAIADILEKELKKF